MQLWYITLSWSTVIHLPFAIRQAAAGDFWHIWRIQCFTERLMLNVWSLAKVAKVCKMWKTFSDGWGGSCHNLSSEQNIRSVQRLQNTNTNTITNTKINTNTNTHWSDHHKKFQKTSGVFKDGCEKCRWKEFKRCFPSQRPPNSKMTTFWNIQRTPLRGGPML